MIIICARGCKLRKQFQKLLQQASTIHALKFYWYNILLAPNKYATLYDQYTYPVLQHQYQKVG